VKLYEIQEPGSEKDIEFTTSIESMPVVGIDLGTTNSLIGYVKNDEVCLIPDQYSGKKYTPSVLAFDGEKILIGQEALDSTLPCLASVKRLLSHKGDSGMPLVTLGNRSITPIEASAEILKYLKERAEQHLANKIEKAVITVPAYFDENARQATKAAARLAGLEVMRLISEPTAAAIAYGFTQPEGLYAVYDLGGGTFDISILKMQKGVFQVLASGGDTFLGGDDLDVLLMEFGLDKAEARSAKERLSEAEAVGTITRKDLERLAKPIIDRTLKLFSKTMLDAQIEFSELKEVILVGGATRMPLISQEISALVGKTPISHINPDEVVAIGAAHQAHFLSGSGDHLLIDVIPLSLGIEVGEGIAEVIIPRNTPIPAVRTQLLTTQKDNQTGIVVHVIQGEGKKVIECRSLAKFELKGIPPMPKGAAKVEVKFQIDADGLLTVYAREMITGKAQSVEVKPSYGLSEDEILALLKQ
jgi:molecular chaperone HscA